jgi:hypothetical protein
VNRMDNPEKYFIRNIFDAVSYMNACEGQNNDLPTELTLKTFETEKLIDKKIKSILLIHPDLEAHVKSLAEFILHTEYFFSHTNTIGKLGDLGYVFVSTMDDMITPNASVLGNVVYNSVLIRQSKKLVHAKPDEAPGEDMDHEEFKQKHQWLKSLHLLGDSDDKVAYTQLELNFQLCEWFIKYMDEREPRTKDYMNIKMRNNGL